MSVDENNMSIPEYDKQKGFFPFSSEGIDNNVPENATGVYLLSKGQVNDKGRYIVSYVGRAEATESEDLRKRLHAHLNNPDWQDKKGDSDECIFKVFWYYLEPDSLAAYKRECLDYHRFGGKPLLLNKNHPDRRDGHPEDCCPVTGCEEAAPDTKD